MKTPKQEAADLILEFLSILGHKPQEAKQCAIVTVNRILSDTGADRGYQYWSEVKDILNGTSLF